MVQSVKRIATCSEVRINISETVLLLTTAPVPTHPRILFLSGIFLCGTERLEPEADYCCS